MDLVDPVVRPDVDCRDVGGHPNGGEWQDRGCLDQGRHTIDRIRAGELSFMVVGGTAPAIICNVHQALCPFVAAMIRIAVGVACDSRQYANRLWTG